MRKRMLEYIRRHQMMAPGDKVVAGLSGGADSVCLLSLLAGLRGELGIELEAVHLHHGLRGEEADRDAAYAGELSGRLKVPFLVVRKDVAAYARDHGLSVEEAGRELRYQVLEEEMGRWGANRIAVAHHADDNAETILHNLFRGSGLKGLGGIVPVRGPLVRPLLPFAREEILAYLKEQGLGYCQDSSNGSMEYTRNKLRHLVIPLVQREINEGAVGNILHAGKLAAEADRFLEAWAGKMFMESRLEGQGGIGLPASLFFSQEKIIQQYLARRLLKEAAPAMRDLSWAHVDAICLLAGKPVGRQASLPYGLSAVKTYDAVWIQEARKAAGAAQSMPMPSFSVFPYQKGQEIPKNMYTKWFDYDKIKGTLSVRYRKTGDYITLASGGRKTIKAYMIDEKIPRDMRSQVPLLAEGSHVLWILGGRTSEYYKITGDTCMVLQVQLNGGKSNV